MIKQFNLYIKICLKNKILVFGGFLLLTVDGILSFNIPFLMNHVMDDLFRVNNKNFYLFLNSFTIYTIIYIIQIIINYINTLVFKKMGIKISQDISSQLVNKIYNSKKTIPTQFSASEILQVLNSDLFGIGEKGIQIVYQVIYTIINIIALFYYMWITSLVLAIVVTGIFIIIMCIQQKINNRITCFVEDVREANGKYSYTANDFVSNYNNYKKIKCFSYFHNQYKNKLNLFFSKLFNLNKLISKNRLINSFSIAINMILIFWIGSKQILNGSISLSSLVTFNMYANNFGGYIISIPDILISIKQFIVSYQRVCKIINTNNYIGAADLPPIDYIRKIELEDICFSYNNFIILDNYNLKIEEGKIYCIVGANGSGKTTLLSLLIGDYQIKSGKMLINDHTVDPYIFRNQLERHISYLPSEAVLFNDSVRNNILIGRDIDDNQILHIYEQLHVDYNKELNLDMQIDDKKQNLSDGQKQKIAIIRSLLDENEIYIFDEIEKHLDILTKISVMDYLAQINSNKIIIIVSHDSTIQSKCDVIINI